MKTSKPYWIHIAQSVMIIFCFIMVILWAQDMPMRTQWQVLKLWLQPLPSDNSLPNPAPKQRFIDTCGAAHSDGRKHEGVDIFAKRGTPVISNIDGVVWKMENNRLGGTLVWLIGAGDAFHYYTHLHKYENIKPYQYVKYDDIIAYVGDTGNAKTTPPHLYYDIYVQGKAVNPYPLLNKKS